MAQFPKTTSFLAGLIFWGISSLMIIIQPVFAQIEEEDVLEIEGESEDPSELVEIIKKLHSKPINLNAASITELEAIPWLTGELAYQIILHRQKIGNYKQVKQLLEIPYIDQQLFEKIEPCLTVSKHQQLFNIAIDGRHRITRKKEKSLAFLNHHYSGGPEKVYNRLNLSLGQQFQMGTLLEKDSGEPSLRDFQSYYLKLDSIAGTSRVAAGYFYLEVGQGLALWGPCGFGKGSEPITPIKKRARGLRSYTTVDENRGFTGMGIQTNLNRLGLICFYSNTKLDATLNEDGAVTSFLSTGYHRTKSEIDRRDRVKERLYGLDVTYRFANSMQFGTVFFQSGYDHIVINKFPDKKHFDFTGEKNYVASFYFDFLFAKSNLFGEIARSANNGTALLLGSTLLQGPVSLILAYRHYTPDYQNPHSYGFGDSNGNTQNEIGCYTGLRWCIHRNIIASGYLDHYRHPWRTYFQPLPTNGYDSMVQLSIKPAHSILLNFRYKYQNSESVASAVDSINQEIRQFFQGNKANFRSQLDVRLSNQWFLRTRVEFVRVEKECFEKKTVPQQISRGFLFYGDIRYFYRPGFQIYGRIIFFDTNDYDSRVYQYETDLPGIMSNVALQHRGSRWYVFINFRLWHNIRLTFKYASTLLDNQDFIGSGIDLIQGVELHQSGLQLDWQL